jgi:hypothetical protein
MKRLIISMILAVVFAAGCQQVAPPLPNQVPIAVIDSIFPAETSPGQKVRFSGHGSDADGTVTAYTWRSSLDGDIGTAASFESSSLSAGKHSVYFKVKDNNDTWSEEVQQTVIVIKRPLVPPPVIDFFQSSPVRIGTGDSSTLSWHISGATTAYIDQDVGNVSLSGSIKVSPILNRQYTLTATNEDSSSIAAVIIIVVPTKVGLPVISSFAAEPGNITSGKSALLRWNVANSEYVKIDPGIKSNDPIGSERISPTKNTVYTITAYNGVGIVMSTTQVMVTAMPASGLPDLVLTSIGKIETSSGIKLAYTVENRGTNDAPPSTTRLYANGVYRASDSLGALPAGAMVTRQISGWLYNPATSVIDIAVDADNNVIESDRSNNRQVMSLPVEMEYDFISNARSATWGVGYPYKQIKYGELLVDQGGAALDETGNKTEDAVAHAKILVTWPYAAYSGWIMGDYTSGFQVTPGDHFYGLVGLMEGAFGGDVSFWVYTRLNGDTEWEELVPGIQHVFNYRVESFSVPLPPKYFGKKIDFSLRVCANRDPFQDWAAWVEARIIR